MAKVMICVDMEGICGISNWRQCTPGDPAWINTGRTLMAAEVRVVAEALLNAGIDAITVVDAHWNSANLIDEDFSHFGEKLHIHHPKSLFRETMVPDVGSYQGLVILGGHAGSGNLDGMPFSHTVSSSIHDLHLNDLPANETVLNAMAAAGYGVPVLLAAGQPAMLAELPLNLFPAAALISTDGPPRDIYQRLAEAAQNRAAALLSEGLPVYDASGPCALSLTGPIHVVKAMLAAGGTLKDETASLTLTNPMAAYQFLLDAFRPERTYEATPRSLPIIGPGNDLRTIIELRLLRPQMVAAAQRVYDAWSQNDDGYDEALGSGGICQDVAGAISDLLTENGIESAQVGSAIGEPHVFVVAKLKTGVYEIDIPPDLYETGSGYVWKKLQNVRFALRDIEINLINDDPDLFSEYAQIDDLTDECDDVEPQFDLLSFDM